MTMPSDEDESIAGYDSGESVKSLFSLNTDHTWGMAEG